ncbi:MAG: L,D-transpeptidase [Desulfuromonadaceae bacterium]
MPIRRFITGWAIAITGDMLYFAVIAITTFFIEISIFSNLLTLYERKNHSERTPIAEYPVGTAVRGLKTYPLGLGTVTGIYFNHWWYPTPYSRQVFRDRGIELPLKGGTALRPAELHGTL